MNYKIYLKNLVTHANKTFVLKVYPFKKGTTQQKRYGLTKIKRRIYRKIPLSKDQEEDIRKKLMGRK